MEEKDSKPIHFTALKKIKLSEIRQSYNRKSKSTEGFKKDSNIYGYLINNIDCEN